MSDSILDGGRPHPQSYRPDLPLSQTPQTRPVYDREGHLVGANATSSLAAWADDIVRQLSRSKPAPSKAKVQGYRPDLPTFGFTCAQLQKVTPADTVYWLEHPLTYDEASTGPTFGWGSSGVSAYGRLKGKRR
jgi:hypothetical protein